MHYNDIIMGAMASQITSLTIVYSNFYSGADQRKYQSSASLAFVRGIHRGTVNSPYIWPVTRKMVPFNDVIMGKRLWWEPHLSKTQTNLYSHYWYCLTSPNTDHRSENYTNDMINIGSSITLHMSHFLFWLLLSGNAHYFRAIIKNYFGNCQDAIQTSFRFCHYHHALLLFEPRDACVRQ